MKETKESHVDILRLRCAHGLVDSKLTLDSTTFGLWRRNKICKSEPLKIIWENSLFGCLGNHGERDVSLSMDVLSGAFVCWDKEPSRADGEIYKIKFGDALNSPEYEKDYELVLRVPLDPELYNLQEVDEEHPTDVQTTEKQVRSWFN